MQNMYRTIFHYTNELSVGYKAINRTITRKNTRQIDNDIKFNRILLFNDIEISAICLLIFLNVCACRDFNYVIFRRTHIKIHYWDATSE